MTTTEEFGWALEQLNGDAIEIHEAPNYPRRVTISVRGTVGLAPVPCTEEVFIVLELADAMEVSIQLLAFIEKLRRR